MKEIIIFLIPILFSLLLLSAQKANVSSSVFPQWLRDFYLQRNKTRTTGGMALLIAGIVVANEQIKTNAGQSPPSHPVGLEAGACYQEAEYPFGISRNGLFGAVVFIDA